MNVPHHFAAALASGDTPPLYLLDAEKAACEQLAAFYKNVSRYSAVIATRPQTLGHGLSDSPGGLAAWLYDKFVAWTESGGGPERVLARDVLLGDITLYWLTKTATTSARLYWENYANNFMSRDNHIAPCRSPKS